MRKNDEGYPLFIGDSGKVETQSRLISCVNSFIQRIKNVVFQSIANEPFWTKSSRINLMLVMEVKLIYFQIAYQGSRRIGTMSFIKLLIQQLGLSKTSTIALPSRNEQKDFDKSHACILAVNNLLLPESEEDEDEMDRKFQAEIDDIMNQVGADGFTPYDKGILRTNLPIPEEYGVYEPIPDHLRKSIPIKYVPEKNIFVVDEERLENRKFGDS